MADKINHPPHYNYGKYEHIEVVENWKLGYHLGNATKYVMRAAYKGDTLDDLKKSRWYLTRTIEKPHYGFVWFPFHSDMSSRFNVEDVADDWTNGDELLRTVIVEIGHASVNPQDCEEFVTRLMLARDSLDKRILKEALDT